MVDSPILKKVEIDAYVLPTLGCYTAYADIDVDKYAKKHGKVANEIKINVYSPERLSSGELADISASLDEDWGRYLCKLEFSRETFKWLKWMALVEGGIVAGMVGSDFIPIYPMSGLSLYYRAAIDIFFWGSLIFGPVTIAGIRVLTHYGRESRARMLVDNWRETTAIMGSDRKKFDLVSKVNEYWAKLDGKEIDIYTAMRDFCEKKRYDAPYEFYKFKVEAIEKEKSFHLKYRPTTFLGKLRNIFLGPKIVSPIIQSPMRPMEKKGRK